MKKIDIYKINILDTLKILFWFLALLSYFFQFPFTFLSRFISIFLLLYLISSLPTNLHITKEAIFYLSIYYLYLGFECFNSAFNLTDISRIVRFLEILFLIPVFSLLRDNKFEKEFNILVFFAVLKSLVLIGIAVYLLRIGSHVRIRNWVHSISGGDIYFSGRVPKIQTQGNGILPLVLITYYLKTQRVNIFTLVLFLGILAAGNFAFLLAILCLVLLLIIKKIRNDKQLYFLTKISFLFLLIMPILIAYLNKKIEEKSGYSNAIRFEQMDVLLNDMNYFIGEGLGNYIYAERSFRTYDGNLYYELQSLYIFNQIGLIGMILFYVSTIYTVYLKGKQNLFIYLIYLFYTFWNPYCFDTTNMIAIFIACNLGFSKRNIVQHNNRKKSVMNTFLVNYLVKFKGEVE